MNLANISMVAYTLLAFVGMFYGASIDRIGMVIAVIPGLFGLLGFMLWAASPEAHEYSEILRAKNTARRIESMRRSMARRATRHAHTLTH